MPTLLILKMNGQEGIRGFQVCQSCLFFRKVSQYHNYLIFKGTRGKLGIVRFVENPLVGYGLPGKKVSHFLDYV